jgi:hypothetical protein
MKQEIVDAKRSLQSPLLHDTSSKAVRSYSLAGHIVSEEDAPKVRIEGPNEITVNEIEEGEVGESEVTLTYDYTTPSSVPEPQSSVFLLVCLILSVAYYRTQHRKH